MKRRRVIGLYGTAVSLAAAIGLVWMGLACNGGGVAPVGGPGSGGEDQNVLLSEALSYEGTLSGKVFDAQSTRDSLDDGSAAQATPTTIDTGATCVIVEDIMGGDLLDSNGLPIREVGMNSDGSFSLAGLPVGTDFTVCVDIGCNGHCDVQAFVNIPSDDGGKVGDLPDIRVDPLTTMVLAKLREMIEERGIDPRDLPISPVAVVTRIVSAYTHLFEESGIDHVITLGDIEALTNEEIARLFDLILPAGARTGMQIVEGNLDAAVAEDAEALALSAAKVFLRSGFPIVDQPGGVDLSPLGELEDVTTTTFEELFGGPEMEYFEEGFPEDVPGGFTDGFPDGFTEDMLDEFPDGFTEDMLTEFPDGFPDDFPFDEFGISTAEADGDDHFEPMPGGEVIYISTISEPDRNFINADGPEGEEGMPPMPILNDHILLEMARHQLEGRRITLGDLHGVLTSLEEGLGARLTYFVHDPNFFGPPLNVFESVDGHGKALNLERILFEVFSQGFDDMEPEEFEQQEREIRQLLIDMLADTVPPAFDRLMDGFTDERVAGIEDLAHRIREARAHLPFNHTGASQFFVVADGDPFMSDSPVSPITINAEVTPDGEVLGAEYDPSGNGAFFLGFTERTEEGGIVELIVRETGRFLHSQRGPVRLSMNDAGLFPPINGVPFLDFVSQAGVFYPSTNVPVISGEFVLEPTGLEMEGPHEQILVLATAPGAESEPVRVDFNRETGKATYNPGGRQLLMFLPESHETGMFALFNEDTGRPASERDPVDFFGGPMERPDGFEDFFNEFDGFQDFTDMDDLLGEFDQFWEEHPDDMWIPPDEELPPFEGDVPTGGEFPDPPPDGEYPPPDGEFPPPDGEYPPTDGEYPPPDGEYPPPDGEQPPTEDGAPPPTGDQPPPESDVPLDPAEDLGDPPPADGAVPDEGTDQGDVPPIDGPEFDFDVPDEGDMLEPPSAVGEPPEEPLFDGEPPPFDGPFEGPFDGGFHEPEFILISAHGVIGIDLQAEFFTHVFGTEVPNPRYDPDADPYFDDINGNGVHDPGEPTAPFRPTLFDARDWRSTDIRLYYRRADNGQSVSFDDVAFESDRPQTQDGVELVPRHLVPRLNAFRFGRPNTAINLLTAFTPPEFFDGTHALNRDTLVDVFGSVAIINLIMDQVFNVEAEVDIDGMGPMPRIRMLMDAYLFVMPIGDPFQLIMEGFRRRSVVIDGSV